MRAENVSIPAIRGFAPPDEEGDSVVAAKLPPTPAAAPTRGSPIAVPIRGAKQASRILSTIFLTFSLDDHITMSDVNR